MHSTADSREVNDSDLEFGPDPLDLPNNIMDEAVNARPQSPRSFQGTSIPGRAAPEDAPNPRPQSPRPFQGTSDPGRANRETRASAPPASHADQSVPGRAEVEVSPASPLDDLEPEDTQNTTAGVTIGASLATGEPRVLYIDVDDDLAALLDRVEETGSAAIVVLPEGARAVRGVVASRLLKRRAEAAGIALSAVTTDRVAIAQFTAIGIPCSATVGEARLKFRRPGPPAPRSTAPIEPPDPDPPESIQDPPRSTPSPVSHGSEQDGERVPGAESEDEPESPPHPLPRGSGPGAPRVAHAPPDQDDDDLEDRQTILDPGFGAGLGRVLPAQAAGRPRWPLALFASAFVIVLAVSIWVVGMGAATGIALHHTQLSEVSTVLVAGTGTRLAPGAHATGTVTFANQADGYVLAPAGTIVDAGSGGRYATLADAHVPAAVHSFSGSTNGEVNVGVRALAGGTSANVGQGTVTVIEGRLAGVLLVINYAPITGGAMRTEYSVTATDVANAAAGLRARLAAREAESLSQRFARSPIRFPGPVKVTAPRVTLVNRAGRPFARVAITASMSMEYVHGQDVQNLADTSRDRDLAGLNQRILPGTERITLSTRGQGTRRIVLARVQARTTPTIDVTSLRALLVGLSVADARRLLDESARNGGWQYTLTTRPDLAGRLPQAAGLIDVRVRQIG